MIIIAATRNPLIYSTALGTALTVVAVVALCVRQMIRWNEGPTPAWLRWGVLATATLSTLLLAVLVIARFVVIR